MRIASDLKEHKRIKDTLNPRNDDNRQLITDNRQPTTGNRQPRTDNLKINHESSNRFHPITRS